MKLTFLLGAWIAMFHAVTAFAQGTVLFVNTSNKAVFDPYTQMPAEPGVMMAGLYYTPNLSEIPDPARPQDGLMLAAVTPVGFSSELPGVFSGGVVQIPGVPAGGQVLLQVRVWSAGYNSYAECFNDGHAGNWVVVGASNTGLVALGGGILPTPTTSSFLDPIHIYLIPEPSTWLLGLLGLAGAGGLALLRHRSMAPH